MLRHSSTVATKAKGATLNYPIDEESESTGSLNFQNYLINGGFGISKRRGSEGGR